MIDKDQLLRQLSLEDLLSEVARRALSTRETRWREIDEFLAKYRPPLTAKGIENLDIKLAALLAYEQASDGGKSAAEQAVYKKAGLNVKAPTAKKYRQRVLKEIGGRDLLPLLRSLSETNEILKNILDAPIKKSEGDT